MNETVSAVSPFSTRVAWSSFADTPLIDAPFLSPADRAFLAATAIRRRTVRAREDLLCQGASSDMLHVVVQGWAYRQKILRDGRRQIVSLLVPGDVCNLDTLMFDRSDLDVRMLTDGVVLSFTREMASKLGAEHPGIVQAFTWLGCIDTALISQQAVRLGRQSARERIAHLFCELAVRLGHAQDRGEVSFGLPLKQEHIADALGLTPVHVNRMLNRFRAGGLFASTVRTIVIPDIAALRAVAEFEPGYLHDRKCVDGGDGIVALAGAA